MRIATRGVVFALAGFGLLGLWGCAENNEANVESDSAGKTTSVPLTQGDYGKMAPQAPGKVPEGYPGAAKAAATKGQAPK
jgi:hypothetical protein